MTPRLILNRIPKLASWQWIVLALILAFLADWIIQRPDGRTRELNAAIEAKGSIKLKNYPYQFRVIRVQGETAVMSTPRNVDVPAFRFIGVIHPEINVKNPNDIAFIAAETDLALVQSEAAAIAASQGGIKYIQWELDKPWLTGHGVVLPQ